MEGEADIIEILEEVEMVCIDVQDDRDLRIQRQEAVRILTGFCDEVLRVADAHISADGRQDAADRDIRMWESMEVVVVFPCVPETAIGIS